MLKLRYDCRAGIAFIQCGLKCYDFSSSSGSENEVENYRKPHGFAFNKALLWPFVQLKIKDQRRGKKRNMKLFKMVLHCWDGHTHANTHLHKGGDHRRLTFTGFVVTHSGWASAQACVQVCTCVYMCVHVCAFVRGSNNICAWEIMRL